MVRTCLLHKYTTNNSSLSIETFSEFKAQVWKSIANILNVFAYDVAYKSFNS